MKEFIFNNLELLFALVGAGCIPIFFMIRNNSHMNNSNDVTKLIVRNKKLQENINRQSKSIF